jgi:hypothetical protein
VQGGAARREHHRPRVTTVRSFTDAREGGWGCCCGESIKKTTAMEVRGR